MTHDGNGDQLAHVEATLDDAAENFTAALVLLQKSQKAALGGKTEHAESLQKFAAARLEATQEQVGLAVAILARDPDDGRDPPST